MKNFSYLIYEISQCVVSCEIWIKNPRNGSNLHEQFNGTDMVYGTTCSFDGS